MAARPNPTEVEYSGGIMAGASLPALPTALRPWQIAFWIVWIAAAAAAQPRPPIRLTANVGSLKFDAATGETVGMTFTVTYEDTEDRDVSCLVNVNPPFEISPRSFQSDWKTHPRTGATWKQNFEITVKLPPRTAPGAYAAQITIGESGPDAMVSLLAIPVTAVVSSTKGSDNPGGSKPSPPLWNSWIREFPQGAPVTQLEPEKAYKFRFDLAAFDYSKFFKEAATTGIDVDFNRELSSIPDETTEVLVIPVILGHGLKFLPGEEAARKWTIDLGKLRLPPDDVSQQDNLPAFADKVNAIYANESKTTRASIGVIGSGAGCAAVALTIWKPGFNRPLDHIVRQVSVGPPGSAPACPSTVTASPLKSGLLSLLALPFEQPASAALQIFETRVGTAESVSAAIFLKEGEPREILAWNPSTLLSDFVGKDEAQGLRRQVQVARCAQKEAGSCVHDYSTVARQLAAVVFQDDNPEGDRNAKRALAILGELCRQKKPDVSVRFIDAQGTVLFLPVGLLGLGGGDLLGHKANLLYPLPIERPHDPERCLASWTMVLPEHMAEVDDNFLAPVNTAPIDGRISSWKGFMDYASVTSGSKRGEGLVLLTHHGGGLLSFFPGTRDSLNDVEFQRPYPEGGVAILAACSIAQFAGDNKGLPLLTRVNRAGITAAVVSPFDVPAPLGARLAVHFADQVQRATTTGEKATVLTLFERARTAVAADPQARRYAPELDEFLIVGDSRVELCPKGNPP